MKVKDNKLWGIMRIMVGYKGLSLPSICIYS